MLLSGDIATFNLGIQVMPFAQLCESFAGYDKTTRLSYLAITHSDPLCKLHISHNHSVPDTQKLLSMILLTVFRNKSRKLSVYDASLKDSATGSLVLRSLLKADEVSCSILQSMVG